jgi:predicted secreted protein
MTTAAISGFGSTIQWNGHAIAEIRTIGGPSLKADTIDVTSHDSTSTFKEFIAGLRDGGEISIDGIFIPGDTDGQIAMVTDFASGTARTAIITGPSAAAFTWTVTAIITSLDFRQPHDKELPFSAKLKITGVPVLGVTAATGPTDILVTGNVSGSLTETPTYAAGTYLYSVDTSAEASVTVTVTAAGADTITVNGSAVTTGVPSSAITMTSGEITTITVIVGETGKVNKTYVVYCVGGT